MTDTGSTSIVRNEFQKLLRTDRDGEIDDVPLAELGLDSLDFYEKLLFLEDEYGIKIPITDLDQEVTLGTILSTLKDPVD